jgi:hypothetical protein
MWRSLLPSLAIPLPDTRTGRSPCPVPRASRTSRRARIDLGPATTPGPSESGPSYSVGTRLLVTADGATAIGCGATRYYDEGTAAAWRS